VAKLSLSSSIKYRKAQRQAELPDDRVLSQLRSGYSEETRKVLEPRDYFFDGHLADAGRWHSAEYRMVVPPYVVAMMGRTIHWCSELPL
jgi:hypothetical protein